MDLVEIFILNNVQRQETLNKWFRNSDYHTSLKPFVTGDQLSFTTDDFLCNSPRKVPKLKTTTTVLVMLSLASDPIVETVFNVQIELKPFWI
tara:strand:- start:3870 stop:4145 length:276 start_codon:yes stop_codon:yes gene_type:complete